MEYKIYVNVQGKDETTKVGGENAIKKKKEKSQSKYYTQETDIVKQTNKR